MSRTLRFRSRTIRDEEEAGGWTPNLSPAPVGSSNIQSVSSSQMTSNMKSAYGGTDFTTTDTSDWQTIQSGSIEIPSGSQMLMFIAGAGFSHSAAAAEVSFKVLLEKITGGAVYVLQQRSNLYLATATKRSSMLMSKIYHVPTGLPDVSPGLRTMWLQAFNHTAGTLTVYKTAPDTANLSVFTMGSII